MAKALRICLGRLSASRGKSVPTEIFSKRQGMYAEKEQHSSTGDAVKRGKAEGERMSCDDIITRARPQGGWPQ